MSVSERLRKKIHEALSPDHLEVINESHLHKGHQQAFDGSGETHLRVRVTSAKFAGLSRVARHRVINSIAAAELAAGLHALAIEAHAPNEKAS